MSAGLLVIWVISLVLAGSVGATTVSQEAAFEGTQEAGGPVRLVLAADGASIVLFEVEGVAGGGCSWDTLTLDNWGGPVALLDGQFAATNPDGDTLAGALLPDPAPVRRFEGTVQVRDPAKGCETPALRWVAAETTNTAAMP